MGRWTKRSLSLSLPGINTVLLKATVKALELSLREPLEQVKNIEKYLEKILNPLIENIEDKLNSLLELIKIYDIGVHTCTFESNDGELVDEKICALFEKADFFKEDIAAAGTLFLAKSNMKKVYEKQKKALRTIFKADDLNSWKSLTAGAFIPVFDPEDAEGLIKKIIDMLKERLNKLKEKKRLMIDFLEKELKSYIREVEKKIEELEKLLSASATMGIYKLNIEQVKSRDELLQYIKDSFDPEITSDAPVFEKDDAAAGVSVLVSENISSFAVKYSMLKKIINI